MVKTIDVHSHFLTDKYITALKKHNVEHVDGFPHPSWNIDEHLKFMEESKIDMCLLSLSTPHQHFGDLEEAKELTRYLNEYISKIKKQYPDKFLFGACVPLPDVDLSIEEVKYSYDILDADAIKVPSQANGVYLGDKSLSPFFEELNNRNAIVIIHPSKPEEVPKNCFTSELAPLFEYIADTTRAVINMIANGTLEKYPNIKVIVPHCGSFLPNVIDRLEGITKALSSMGIGKEIDVSKSLKNLYFDVAGDALPRGTEILMTLTDEDHILFGGDYPYTPKEIVKKRRDDLESYAIKQGFADKLMYKNAVNLFNL